jgi:hypothetical protein
MVVKLANGQMVSFVGIGNEGKHGKGLIDENGVEWFRNPAVDVNQWNKNLVGYTNSETGCNARLTTYEYNRVLDGVHAMNKPTCLEELRRYTKRLHQSLRPIVDNWPDQKLREILIDAEENNQHPGLVLERHAQMQWRKEHPSEEATEDTGRYTGAHGAPKTGKSTPRPRKQEGSVTVTVGEASVLLTPKQLEFMERLSECPGWDKTGVTGEYIASEYAAELSDSMNSMSVGAVVTTLREKNMISTEKRRMGAIKCCVFKLTETGVEVYKYLAGPERGVNNGNQ